MALNEPVLSGPGAGRTVTYGGGSSAELKLAGEQSGGDWAVVEWRVRAGDEPPVHTHTREDETLYVLEGAITASVGDDTIEVEAGSYAALPKNVPHGLTVRGEEARLLVTLEPAGAEYLLVPRDDSDNDPAKFGLIIHAAAQATVTQLARLLTLTWIIDSHSEAAVAHQRGRRLRLSGRRAEESRLIVRADSSIAANC